MAGFSFGDFLGGAMKGYSFVRQIKNEDEDRARETTLYQRQIANEDEDRKIAREELAEKRKDRETARAALEEQRSQDTTKWNWAVQDRPLEIQRQKTAAEEERYNAAERRYTFGRKVAEGQREDEARSDVQAAYDAAKGAYDAAPGAGFTGQIIADPATRQKVMADQKAKTAGDFMHFYMNEAYPRLRESMLKRGDVEGAAAIDKWVRTERTQKNLDTFGRMAQAVTIGDENTVLDMAANLYNDDNYYDDGLSVVRAKSSIRRDKDGKSTGAVIRFRDDHTGREWDQIINGEQDMYQLLLGTLDPLAAGQMQLDRARAGEAVEAERSKMAYQSELDTNKEIAKAIAEQMGKDPNEALIKRVQAASDQIAQTDTTGKYGRDPASLARAAVELVRAQDAEMGIGARSERRILGVPIPTAQPAAPAAPPVWRPAP